MDMPSTYSQDNYANQNSIVDVTYVKQLKGWIRITETVSLEYHYIYYNQ